MRIEIIPQEVKYEPYTGVDKYEPKSAVIDFQLMFHDLQDKQDFENVQYALTEAVANAIRDFEKAFNMGRGY
jgi:hypothetical protein